MKMYEMIPEVIKLQEYLDQLDVSEEVKQDTIEAHISDLGMDEKAKGIIQVTKTFEAEAKAIKEEEDRLKKRRQALENKAKWMKEYLAENLKAAGIHNLDAGIFKLSFRKTPPSVDIAEGAEVPEGFLIPQDPKVDKTNLKKWLKDGNEAPGISLVQKESLSIR